MWKLKDPPNSLTKMQKLEAIDQLAEFNTEIHVEITGGEPFMKFEELLEISTKVKAQGNSIGVVTAGYPLTPQAIQKLEGRGLTHIAFSIDFPTAAQHDAQRGKPETFKRAVNVIKSLVQMKKQGRDVPTIGIDSIVMEQNLNYLEDVALLAGKLEVEEILFQPIQPDFGLSDQESMSKFRNWLPRNLDRTISVLNRIEDLRGRVPLGQTRQEFALMREYFRNPFCLPPGSCRSPLLNLVVDVTGEVMHCFGHPRTGLKSIGVVPRDDIVTLWQSKTATQGRIALASCTLGCGSMLCHSRSSIRKNALSKVGGGRYGLD